LRVFYSAVGGTPKGRLFPLSRDELVECAALVDSVRRDELDRLTIPGQRADGADPGNVRRADIRDSLALGGRHRAGEAAKKFRRNSPA
jgi:hypothetical protein